MNIFGTTPGIVILPHFSDESTQLLPSRLPFKVSFRWDTSVFCSPLVGLGFRV
jgi:hypothetical protein